MSQAEQDRRVDYIEFLTTEIEETKRFYSEVFGWEFTDFGPDYASFTDGRITGGFSVAAEVPAGGPLVVIYSTKRSRHESLRVEGRSSGRYSSFQVDDVFISPIRVEMSWRSGQIDDYLPQSHAGPDNFSLHNQ
jgi:catechol 2,3-dioxygenase-like lactoylglutathione lyase family enzyme